MGDHPAKEARDTNELTDFIFEPPIKDVSIGFFLFFLCQFFFSDIGSRNYSKVEMLCNPTAGNT